MAKRQYRKGMTLYKKDAKEKIVFGKWNDDGTGACIGAGNSFLNLSREVLDADYETEGEINKAAQEKRRGQAW